jgi:CBS domain-containing protein
MRVRDIMTANPECCNPDTPLADIARLMVECDCGEIPVVENRESMKPIGVVTDRDITIRAVAEGRNPLVLRARVVMSSPVVTVKPDSDVDECRELMEKHQVRRIPVADDQGNIVGIVALADVARRSSDDVAGEVVKEVSKPVAAHSR